MSETLSRDFIRNSVSTVLQAVSEGRGSETVINPVVSFTRLAKNHAYDAVTDETWENLIAHLDWISTVFWNDRPEQTYLHLLENLLKHTRLDRNERTRCAFAIAHSFTAGVETAPLPEPDFGFALFPEPGSSATGSDMSGVC